MSLYFHLYVHIKQVFYFIVIKMTRINSLPKLIHKDAKLL